MFVDTAVGLVFMILLFFYVHFALKTVRDPDIAYLFRLDVAVGRLSAGLQLIDPVTEEIDVVQMEVQVRTFEKEPVYVADGVEMDFDVMVIWQAGNTKSDLKKALTLRADDREKTFKNLALSHTRTELGKDEFMDLIKEQEKIEVGALEKLMGKFRKYGHRIKEVQVVRFHDDVISEARKIEKLGEAQGKAAEYLARPFKDNKWATFAFIGQAFIDYLKKSKSAKRIDAKAVKEGGEKLAKTLEGVKEGVKSVTDFAKNITEGGKKDGGE